MDYVSVNLTGFSPENVELYMTRFFQGNTEMVEGLKNRLKESKILTSLSTIPVILMLMCLLWEDEQKLPEAQSELYHKFVLYLWRKHCIRNGKQDQSDSDAEFIKAISELGQTAFEGLCSKETLTDEKLVFSESNFTHSQFQLGCETGLLTRERLRSKLNMISSVTFLHKSFQEYCAAKYWADLFETNPDQFHCTLMQIDSWYLLLSKMELLKFCCGVVDRAGRIDIILHAIHLFKLNTDSMNTDDHACAEVGFFSSDDIKKDLLPILNLLYDSQITPGDGELETTQQHDQVYTDSAMLPCGEQQQSPGGMLSLAQAVKSLFSKGKLSVFSTPPQSMPIFNNFVMSAFGEPSLSKIKSASFEYDDLSVAPLDVVTDSLQCMPVILKVSIYHRTDYTRAGDVDHQDHNMKLLGEALSSLSRLSTISYEGRRTCTNIQPIVHRLSLSSYCPHYTHIKFYSATFNITHMTHLLSKTMHLKKLDLDKNRMTPSDVMSILDAIQSKLEHLSLMINKVAEAIGHIDHIMTPHLQILELGESSLNEEHITILSESLPKATNLQELDLSDNTVGMAVAPLAQQLQYCPRLRKLDLAHAHIPDQGIIEIANRFVFLQSLSWLDLCGNDVGNGGIHEVYKQLHHLTKLQRLVIDATIDNQCSALVKDCLSAIDETVPDTGRDVIDLDTDMYGENSVQLLIKAASKHANQN
ncbi:NLR family CARD domain-containing protein 4-like [Amphiura filiformis]|uniref:NLR family CARD domain-containing protein 4-like n=1 Tax=Amphiura filiformis TaxID=82378 RepID=UPI003B2201E8